MQEPSKAGQSPGPAYDLSHTMTRHARRSLMVLTPVPASIKGPRVDCHCTCSLPSSVPPSHPPFLALRRRQGSQGLLSAATTASSCEYSPKLGLLRPPLGYTPLDVVCHCRPAHPQKRHLPLYLHTISKSPNACPSTSPMTTTSSSTHATRPTSADRPLLRDQRPSLRLLVILSPRPPVYKRSRLGLSHHFDRFGHLKATCPSRSPATNTLHETNVPLNISTIAEL